VRPDVERRLSSALPALRSAWSLMLAANLAFAGLGALASPVAIAPRDASLSPLAAVFAALAVLCAGATIWLDRAVLAPGRLAGLSSIPDPALAQRHLLAGHLALWSIAVLPALLGFAQLLLDGTPGTHLALCALSLLILAALMPTRSRIGARLEAMLG
jgi:hypothetical protein